MEENTITTVECRKLRELIRDITRGCILTYDEYNQICGIIMGAMKRCVWESDKNENTYCGKCGTLLDWENMEDVDAVNV
nr:MAG TPA: Acetone carboxylase gamma subunit [Caudoviricetes sp.]